MHYSNFCRRQFPAGRRRRKLVSLTRGVPPTLGGCAVDARGSKGSEMMTGPSTGEIAARPRAQSSANVIIGLLVGSAFVMILNETIMSVALPALIVDLDISASTAQWLTSGFLLTMAVVIPLSGSL